MTTPFHGAPRGGFLPVVPVLVLFQLLALLLPAGAVPARAADPPPLTLDRAVEEALRNHPDLTLFPPALDAAKGRAERLSVPPNPELEVEVDNLEGGVPWTERASPSVRLSQELDRWKREPRRRAAEGEAAVILRDREAARREVALSARRAFLSAVAADRRFNLARESRDLSASLSAATRERVAAGAVSPIEETRAKVELAAAEAEALRAGREREEAIRELALALGEENPSFTRVEGGLDEGLALPSAGGAAASGESPPEVSRWEAERKRRELVVEAERAEASPSVTVSAGVSRDGDDDTSSFLLGFSLPLPLFDRNRGAVAEARAELRTVDAERRRAETHISARLRKARTAMASSSREGILVRDGMLAGAKEAFEAVEEGYRLGKFRYVDVIEASRSLVEARRKYLEAVTEHNLARVELETLLAPPPPVEEPASVQKDKEEGR